jgi:hypothetical protein
MTLENLSTNDQMLHGNLRDRRAQEGVEPPDSSLSNGDG